MNPSVCDIFAGVNGRPVTAASTPVTAAGTGDATLVSGLVIDLNDGINLNTLQRSVCAIIFGVATVADTKALTIAMNWQSADNAAMSTNATTLESLAAITVFTASGAQTAKPWGVSLTCNLERVTQQYLRIQFTPDLTASGTDTATIFGVYLFGGGQELPVPQAKAFTVAV